MMVLGFIMVDKALPPYGLCIVLVAEKHVASLQRKHTDANSSTSTNASEQFVT